MLCGVDGVLQPLKRTATMLLCEARVDITKRGGVLASSGTQKRV